MNNIISLMYHDICEDAASSGFSGADADLYKLTPAAFDEHLKMVELVGKSPVSVLKFDFESDGEPLFFTFDDGGNGAMRAAEMLDSRGWIGHFFITTDRINTTGFLTNAEIADLHSRGHVIGSHSASHPLRMAALSKRLIEEEWKMSLVTLSDLLSSRVEVASVPGGYYSEMVRDIAFESGVRFLFNSEPTQSLLKVENNYVMGRYTVTASTEGQELFRVVSGNKLPWMKQSLVWSLKKPVKRLGGESFLKFRKYLMRFRTG